ncbi:hypothetical protein BASA81_009115 [Batrachochytrium salamandrivorans]|nr:hypothetical protein BASA81_009115 [Batrachochytrium salamandrivorans]
MFPQRDLGVLRLDCGEAVGHAELVRRLEAQESEVTALDVHCAPPRTVASTLWVLPQKTAITRLSFKNAGLDLNQLASLCEILPETCVTSLNLAMNDLGPCGVAKLCRTHALVKLKTLDLSFNEFGSRGMRDLACSLVGGLSLTRLSVEGNSVSDWGFKWLSRALQHPKCELETLMLGSCAMSASVLQDFAIALTLGRIKRFTIGTSAGDINAFNVALTHPNCQLRSLSLFDSNAAPFGEEVEREEEDGEVEFVDPMVFASFLRALSHGNCKLTALGLVGFPLGYRLVTKLCTTIAGLPCRRSLTKLNLARAYVGTLGAKAVRQLVCDAGCRLRVLEMPHNYLGDRGVGHLIAALASERCGLETLDLCFNLVNHSTAMALERQLRLPHSRLNCVKLLESNDWGDQVDDNDGDENTTQGDYYQRFDYVYNTLDNMRVARACLALRPSPRQTTCSGVTRLPRELIRLVAGMLQVVPKNEEEEGGEEDRT